MGLKNQLAVAADPMIEMQQAVARVLSSKQIGEWSSDHSKEAQSFQGWNYMAIAAIGRQAAQATGYVYARGSHPHTTLRKSLKNQHKQFWKAFATDGAADTVPEDHWVSKLVQQPNPTQTAPLFQWEFIQQMHLHGCCLIFNRPNKDFDRVVERYIVPMALTQPVYPGQYDSAPNGGVRILHYAAGLGFIVHPMIRALAGCIIPVEWLSINRNPDPVLRGDGKSPTDAAGWWIDSALMVDMARWKHLKRGPRPHGIVTVKGDNLDDTQLDAIEKRLNKKLGAEEYDERAIVVRDGVNVPTETSPKDMDYIQAFEQLGKAVMAVHGVGKAMVGLTDNMTHGSLSAALSQSASVVQSDLDMLGGDYTMLAKQYGENVDVQYEVPTYDDPALTEQRLTTDLQAGIRTGREWRAIRGLPPFGDWRDDARVTPQGFVLDTDPPKASSTSTSFAGSAEEPASGDGGFGLIDNGVPEPGGPKSLAKAYRKQNFVLSEQVPIIAVDLDGTLAEEVEYDPEFIGPPIDQKVQEVRMLKEAGCLIAIWTCRDTDELVMDWLDTFGVPWDAINANPVGMETASNKIFAHVYWDNRAVDAESSVREVAERLPSGVVRDRLLASTKAEAKKPGCVMLEMPPTLTAAVLDEHARILPESLRGDGLETWPHVTVLYGIMGVSVQEVIEAVRRIDQLDISFGPVSTFEKADGSAVLKVEVESYPLHRAHERLSGSLPVMETFPDYNPHLTLGIVDAYSPEALNAPYECSLSGRSVRVTHAVISMEGNTYRVPLRQSAGEKPPASSLRFDMAAVD